MKRLLIFLSFIFFFNIHAQDSDHFEIDLLWDASYSMIKKDTEKEFDLLDQYFKTIGNSKVHLVIFSNQIHYEHSYTITNGDWQELKNKLNQVIYDGATDLSALDRISINTKSDLVILSSDLLSNMSTDMAGFKRPIVLINNAETYNTALADELVTNGGKVIDLHEKSVAESLTAIRVMSTTEVAEGKNETIEIDVIKHKKKGNYDQIDGDLSNIKGDFRLLGNVYNDFGPIPSVSVTKKGTSNGTTSDIDGNYEIKVKPGDILIFSHISYKNKEIEVKTQRLDVDMDSELHQLDEVIVSAKKPLVFKDRTELSRGFSVSRITSRDVGAIQTLASMLRGRIPGLSMRGNDLSSVRIRETQGFETGSVPPLFVLDGAPISIAAAETIIPETVDYIEAIRGLRGTNRYGAAAEGGVIFVYTKNNGMNRKKKVKERKQEIDYIKDYKGLKNKEAFYEMYLKQRSTYKDHPAYFLDVYELFKRKGFANYANRIASNIIETDFEDHEILKAYAFELEKAKQYKKAIFVYNRILELKPAEIQSYRDLANAFRLDKEYEKAGVLYDIILQGELFANPDELQKEVKYVVYDELNEMLNASPDLREKPRFKKYTPEKEMALRIVVEWNHYDTDIDLHVVEPTDETCYIGNPETAIGGRLFYDVPALGPEAYILTKAFKGEYEVRLSYARDYQSEIENPTFVKVTVYKNYGGPNQTKEQRNVRLSGSSREVSVMKINL